MKKPKLIFKVNNNYLAKVYVGGKWCKDVAAIDIKGIPCKFEVRLLKYKRNSQGCFYTEYDENGELCIAQEVKVYHIKEDNNGNNT